MSRKPTGTAGMPTDVLVEVQKSWAKLSQELAAIKKQLLQAKKDRQEVKDGLAAIKPAVDTLETAVQELVHHAEYQDALLLEREMHIQSELTAVSELAGKLAVKIALKNEQARRLRAEEPDGEP